MDSSATEQLAEKSLPETATAEVGDALEKQANKQIANSKIWIDAERIRSSISRLTSNSTDELEKLVSKLQELQEFLKSETSRVQSEIGSVLDGVGTLSRPSLHGKPTSAPMSAQMDVTNLNVGLDFRFPR